MVEKRGVELAELLEELNAGIFASKCARALAEVALGVVTYGDKGKTGKVTISFDLKRIGESNQVMLTHQVSYSNPTMRGKATEVDSTLTPMHVGRGGQLSLMPDTQARLDFAKKED